MHSNAFLESSLPVQALQTQLYFPKVLYLCNTVYFVIQTTRILKGFETIDVVM